MEVKLSVGNLAPATTEAELRQLFSQAGVVTGVLLLPERPGGQAGASAQITMATLPEAQTAIDHFHDFSLAGRPLFVKLARLRATAASHQGQLGAFGTPNQGSKPRWSPKARGNPASGGLSAFGGGSGSSTEPRSRRNNRRP